MTETPVAGPFTLVILLLIPLFAFGVAGFVYQQQRRRQRTSPISAGLLRPAGYTLSQQIVDRQFDIASAFGFGLVSVLVPYVVHLQQALTTGSAPHLLLPFVSGALLLTGTVTFGIFSLKRLSALRTGLEAETAIGQALETMIARGYRVYHDIPADGFNVDHLAVGPAGVFVIETKGRSKPLRLREGRRRRDYEVTFRNGVLEFPGWKESAPIAQTLATTRWVNDWLSRSTGQPVEARPVLAIPGWWIERKSAPPPWITNGAKIEQVFANATGTPLDSQRIEQICYQIEQRVRVKGLVTDSAEAKQA